MENAVALVNELAATGLAIFDKEEERRSFCSTINNEIKKLKKRYRQIAAEVKDGGVQLKMNFGSVVTDNEPDKPKKVRKNTAAAVASVQ